MRILLIHNYYQIHGGEDVYVDNLYHLLKKNHDVILFTRKNDRIKNTASEKVKVAIRMLDTQKESRRLNAVIKSFHPNIAHINNLYPLLTPSVRDTLFAHHIPTVETIHTYRPLCPKGNLFRNNSVCELCVKKQIPYPSIIHGCYHKSKIASLLMTVSNVLHNPYSQLKHIDKLIFPAQFMKDYFKNVLDLDEDTIEIIPHFAKQKKVNHLLSDGPLPSNYYLFVGRLFPEKGILPLLKTMSQIPEKNLIVIGQGPQYDEVCSYSKYPNITIKGAINNKDLPFYYRHATATIIPSAGIYEVGPLVLMESYAYGTPVISPNFDVFTERVIPNQTGFLFPQNNYKYLRNLLSKNNIEKQLQNMRSAVRLFYTKNYTPEIYSQKLLRVYNTLVYEKTST